MSAVISTSKNLYKHKLTKQENVKEKKTFFCDMKFTDVRQALMKRKWILKRISKNNKGKRIIATGEVIRLIDNFVKNKFLKKGNGKNNDDSSSSSVTTTTTTTTTIVSGASKFIDKMIFPNVSRRFELEPNPF